MKHYRQHTVPNYKMGQHYMNHVMAMTAEDLHSKAEIAEELAVRDMRIEALEALVRMCEDAMEQIEEIDYRLCGDITQLDKALTAI